MRMHSGFLTAAVGGLLLGAAGCASKPAPEAEMPSASTAVASGAEANSCKGMKGKGGCKTEQHACKGMNDCKGQGGCKGA
jgi:hypothetical protein